jgi:hypothetical protein
MTTRRIRMTTRRILAIQALLVVGLLSAGLHAQSVGIGTANPDPSARLHISDNARGLLIPNVALTATNVAAPVTSPATSLLVYNTATAGTGATAVTPGFYYWDGSQWVRLTDGGKAWLLTGNAGTNPAVNFLGTTDAQPLCIRVNNQETFRFNPPGTNPPAWSIQRGGGNQRGLHAVDLQSARSAATQVASGDYSVIGGGGTTPPAAILPPLAGARATPPAASMPPLAGARATPPATVMPPLAGARATPPTKIMPPLAGARATPPAASMPPSAGAGRTPPAAILPPLAGAGTTPPAAMLPPLAGAGRTLPAAATPSCQVGPAILQTATTISSSGRM